MVFTLLCVKSIKGTSEYFRIMIMVFTLLCVKSIERTSEYSWIMIMVFTLLYHLCNFYPLCALKLHMYNYSDISIDKLK